MSHLILRATVLFALVIAVGSAHAHDSPCELTGTIRSVRSGNWSDPGTWGGRIPGASDTVNIATGHTVKVDGNTGSIAGVNVNCTGILEFDPLRSATLESTHNLVVSGTLRMRPSSHTVIQAIRFIGINENNFVGGGMDPLASDVGLWVMGEGQLDLHGSPKTSWTRATGAIAAGATSFAVQNADGWQAGDEISIAPTEAPRDIGWRMNLLQGTVDSTDFLNWFMKFDERTITSLSGTTLNLSASVSRDRPRVNNKWTAEVMNMTRNVRIEGTVRGRTHIFIHSNKPQNIKYAQFRHVGPRNGSTSSDYDPNDSSKRGKIVLGRYGIHFHHSMDGSRGSMVEGSVVRESGSRAYVPHVSHGITLRNNIAYRTHDTAYWWDPGEESHDSRWDGNIAALGYRQKFSAAGYILGKGQNNVARNNVAVGIMSDDGHNLGAYTWSANNEGVWIFENNLAHNNSSALTVWQNTSRPHDINKFEAYHNFIGIFHGAYANAYRYHSLNLYANMLGIEMHAAALDGQQWDNILVDSGGIGEYGVALVGSPVETGLPILLRDVTIRGHRKAGIYEAVSSDFFKSMDVVHCDIMAPQIVFAADARNFEQIRVQPREGQSYVLKKSQGSYFVPEANAYRTDIAPFAPRVWGTGGGLKGEYFDGVNFDRLVSTQLDFMLMFDEWGSDGAHYKLGMTNYSVRWTGKIMPQYSETYTFVLGSGGGHRLWINGQLIMNLWNEHYPDVYESVPIQLQAGQLYNITLEYFNGADSRSSVNLKWRSASQREQYVPQSQLYPPPDFVPSLDHNWHTHH